MTTQLNKIASSTPSSGIDTATSSVSIHATRIANQSEIVGKAISFIIPYSTFSDPTGLPLTYSATLSNGSALPSWLRFDPTVNGFSGIPTTPGTTSVTVKATDSSGLSASETFSFITQGGPVLAKKTATQNEIVGKPIAVTLPISTFTDATGSALTYSATLSNGSALPSWLHFDPTANSFSGVPTTPGTTSVTVKATDIYGLSASETFSFVTQGGPVVAKKTATQNETVGKPISFILPNGTFTDATGSPLNYAVTSSNGAPLPSWLHFDPTANSFSGTPTAAGTTAVTVTAMDNYGLSASETFSFVTKAAGTKASSLAPIDLSFKNSQALSSSSSAFLPTQTALSASNHSVLAIR